MKKKMPYNVAVVGIGAVGKMILKVLRTRNFPIRNLKILGRTSREIDVEWGKYNVEAISPDSFNEIDIALFAGTEGEKGAAVIYGPEAIKRGAVIIDNGADFRLDPEVPLVVPEVNPKDVKRYKNKGIIANPNCSTIQMVVALWPIHKELRINRIIVCTYQAVSGAGRDGIQQLENELSGKEATVKAFAYRIAHNVIPQVGSFQEDDFTTEEWKMVRETQKIMHSDKIKISATTVRVPVYTGHSEAVYIETKKSIKVEQLRQLLASSAGLKVIDNPQENKYPLPIDAEDKDEVFVGRIRKDPFVKNGFWLWIVSDNLLKGAALNAVQIAELLIGRI